MFPLPLTFLKSDVIFSSIFANLTNYQILNVQNFISFIASGFSFHLRQFFCNFFMSYFWTLVSPHRPYSLPHIFQSQASSYLWMSEWDYVDDLISFKKRPKTTALMSPETTISVQKKYQCYFSCFSFFALCSFAKRLTCKGI